MTRQEIFDKVVAHLRAQGKQAITDGGTCMYRADDGSMCAVGCLIKDEFYDPSFEKKDVNHYKVVEALKSSGIDMEFHTKNLLDDLQSLHDRRTIYFCENGNWTNHQCNKFDDLKTAWETGFAFIVHKHKLEFAPL